MNKVEFLRSKGYPKKIIGNGGYPATLVDNDYAAVYHYPRGYCVHGLAEIVKYFEIIEK